MSDKPAALVRIDDLVANLRTTMARAGDVFPTSMRNQLAQTVSAFLRLSLADHPFIHPGMAKMARWGQCCERQARRNFGTFEAWGIVTVVAYPKGGRRASRFVVNFDAIRDTLVELGANPSKALCDKLRDARNPDINPDIKADANPDICPDTMSAGIQTVGEGHFSTLRLIAGGRHV